MSVDFFYAALIDYLMFLQFSLFRVRSPMYSRYRVDPVLIKKGGISSIRYIYCDNSLAAFIARVTLRRSFYDSYYVLLSAL